MIWQTADFIRILELLVPSPIRLRTMLDFLKANMGVMRQIHEGTLYKMQHTPQVIYLEKVLNEWFQVAGYDTQNHEVTKRVFIGNAPVAPRTYIYLPEEEQPMYLGTVYLGGAPIVNYRFTINVPSSYAFEEAKLRAVVDYYKLAGKKYIIQLYDL